MDNLAATLTNSFVATGTVNRSFGQNQPDSVNYVAQAVFAFGTGALQAQSLYRGKRTLATAAFEDLDLAGGIVDDFGTTITFTELKGIYFENLSSTQTLSLGGAAANAIAALFGTTTDKLKFPPLTSLQLFTRDATGYPVVAGTGDLLRVTNSAGASADYYLGLLGN